MRNRIPDKATTEKIVRFVKGGAFVETAAVAAGLSAGFFARIMKRGRAALDNEAAGKALDEAEKTLADFAQAIDQAVHRAVLKDIRTIRKAALSGVVEEEKTTVVDEKGGVKETVKTKRRPESWQAAAWRLERRCPELCAKSPRERSEKSLEDPEHRGGLAAYDVTKLTPKQLAQLEDLLARCALARNDSPGS